MELIAFEQTRTGAYIFYGYMRLFACFHIDKGQFS